MDLRPHPLVLHPAGGIRQDGATLSWGGAVDADVDHVELWLSDGTAHTMLRLPAAASHADVLLRPATLYRAWIIAVDAAGQGTPSNEIAFESAAAPAGAATGASLGGDAIIGTMLALAILLALMGYAVASLRRRSRE